MSTSAPRHYTMYHNPETMGFGCFDIEDKEEGRGIVATNKEHVANQIAQDGGVIWCIGRADEEDDTFYLFQRIDNPTVESGDEVFSVHLVGTPVFPRKGSVVLNDKPYFGRIEDALHKGVQLLTDSEIIADFEGEFRRLWREDRKQRSGR
ncbi:hypothetical protein [Deinococcus phoenicis]|uniref:hypothetical protein n=1 Tax=Deinococcus phoenicis TaxID=1476583 RepID=UPI001268501F|nr:hypothetical protein [Deinococcus phoenicis]